MILCVKIEYTDMIMTITKKKYILFILLPLIVTLLLGCNVKQEIKKHLALPVNKEIKVKIQNHSCTPILKVDKKSEKQTRVAQLHGTAIHSFLSSIAYFSKSQLSFRYAPNYSIPSPPLFILLRKLII